MVSLLLNSSCRQFCCEVPVISNNTRSPWQGRKRLIIMRVIRVTARAVLASKRMEANRKKRTAKEKEREREREKEDGSKRQRETERPHESGNADPAALSAAACGGKC